jgi:GT2 family glycosyltransferase
LKAFNEIPKASVIQSKIILMDNNNLLDACGAFWTDTSFIYTYGYLKNQTDEKYNISFPIFSTKGASMLIKKEVVNKIGLFDKDFWNYYEETDFCNRAWLAGYECWYYPKAVCYHWVGSTSMTFQNDIIQFHNFKNKLLSILKNFSHRTLVCVLPKYFVLSIIISFAWLLQGRLKHFLSIYRGIFWNLINMDKTMKKRNKIQKMRKNPDEKIFSLVKLNPRLSYYYYLYMNHLEHYRD